MAKELPNQIVGTGKNTGKMFFRSDGNNYSEVLLGDEKNGKQTAVPTLKQYTYEEILEGQEKVTAQKAKTGTDSSMSEAKRAADLVKGVTVALASLPTQEELDRIVKSSKEQLVVGNIAIPSLMEALDSIRTNLDISKLSDIEKSFGETAVETQKSKTNIFNWKVAKGDMELEIERIDVMRKSLNPESPEYKKQIEELDLQEIELRKEFNSKYPVPPEPETQIQYLISDKILGVTSTIDAMVKAINKVYGTELPNGSRVERRIRRIGKTVVSSYDSMVKMLMDTAKYINSSDIDSIIGWKESGVTEYVTFEKEAPDGSKYREYLTKKEFDSYGNETESKIKNIDYFKPHFAAEDSLFRIGEFITKMVDPIQKVSSIDLSGIRGPMRLRRDTRRLADSMSIMVRELIKSFSKIDTSGSKEAIELLMGSQGTESVTETLSSYNANDGKENLTETNQSTERVISGKKASVIDIVSSFIDTCNKIVSFDFKPVLKKSLKFQMMSPLLAKSFNGVVNSMYSMVPDFKYNERIKDLEGLSKFLSEFQKKAFDPFTNMELPVGRLALVSKMLGGPESNKTGVQESESNKLGKPKYKKLTVYGAISNIMSGISEIMDMESKYGTGSKKDFSGMSDRIKSISSLFDDIIDIKESAGNVIGTGSRVLLAEKSVGTVMSAYNDISEIASEPTQLNIAPMVKDMSDAMTLLEPGVTAFGNMIQLTGGISKEDTSKTTQAIMSLVNTMNVVVDSGAAEDINDVTLISNSLEEAITAVVKLNTEAANVSEDSEWIDILFNEETGVMTKFIKAMVGVYETMKNSDLSGKSLDETGESLKSLGSMSKVLVGVMAAAGIISLIVDKAKTSDNSEEKSKKLIDILISPVKEVSENSENIKNAFKPLVLLALELLIMTATIVTVGTIVATHIQEALIGFGAVVLLVGAAIGVMKFLSDKGDDGTIRNGALSLLIIAGAFLAFSMSILVLGLVQDLSWKAMVGFIVMVGMAVGLLILLNHLVNAKKLNKEGMPEICMPLLLIAGSFLLFSMSILMLGLVQDLTLASLGAFILTVGMAVGVLFLLSRLEKEVIKGALALMIAGTAFIMFSVVVAILARVAEDSDFVEMLGLVGVIAALVGVGVLAGLAIIPLALGSIGLIMLSASLLVFSVALTALYGVSKLIGKDAEQAISPLIDTIDAIVSKMSAMSMKAVAVATANSLLALVMIVSMLSVAIMIQALKAVAPKPSETEEVSLAMQGVASALNNISKELSKISIGDMTKALAISAEALLMLVPLSLVALILLGFSRMRIATEFDENSKPIKWESLDGSSFDRVGEVMGGLAGALNTVTKELNKISVKEISKALLVSNEALVMMLPLSLVALILLGFSRMRIATEFDEKNKPVKWESLDGSSFDRVGDTMSNMVNAINNTVHKINEVGLVEMTKAVAKSVEMLAMMASLSGIMAILVKMGSGRIPVEFDEKNKPKAWEDFDSNMIGRSVDIAQLLVKSVGDISNTIATYDTKDIKKAKKNAKTMKGIMKPISAMLDLVIKLTSGPISYGPCDDEGNPIGNGDQVIRGSIGDYLKTHKKQIDDNIDTLIETFNSIADKVSGDGGIGKVNNGSIKKAKKNMKLVGQIVGALQPMIDLITSLTSGQYNVGTEEEPKMMNLGDYISAKKPEVTTNLQNLFDFVNWIGKKAEEMNEGPSNRELRRANRKMGKIGDIIESLNAPLDLIMKMSDGEFEIKDDEGNIIEKMNLGQYIAAKSTIVESNLDTLISFIGHIGDRINTELNGENGPSKRDLKKANKKTGLIGTVLETMMDTLDIIEKMASGKIQVGVDENDKPIMKSLDKFLNESADGINKNIGLLIDFIVGKDGIQSHLDKITGEKSKTSDKKKNEIETIQLFSDTIGSILDLTMDIGKQIDNPKTKDLFGTDKDKSLKARIGRLMEGYSVPLDDTAIFSKPSQFKVRYKNLTDYDKLMKKIMEVKQVDNFEKSVKATGDMVNAINSINDSKIDRLNRLMVNMTKFGETVNESLKEVFDKIVELAEELHYIIEADMRKNDPEEYKRIKKQEEREHNAQLNQQTQQQQQSQPRNQQPAVSSPKIENDLASIESYVKQLKTFFVDNGGQI
jgi:hypothetical protein